MISPRPPIFGLLLVSFAACSSGGSGGTPVPDAGSRSFADGPSGVKPAHDGSAHPLDAKPAVTPTDAKPDREHPNDAGKPATETSTPVDGSHVATDAAAACQDMTGCGAGTEVCNTCMTQRCPATALACANSPACVKASTCESTCMTASCISACTSDPMLQSEVDDYTQCIFSNACSLACANAVGGSCRDLGTKCDPLVPGFETCCAGAGTCVFSDLSGGSCCLGAGGACDPTNAGECCPGTQCGASGACEAITCVPSTTQDCAPGDSPWDMLPCCDPRLTCNALMVGGLAQGSLCCAPVGAPLDQGDSDLCCSHSYDDDTGACVANPPM